MDKIYLVDNNEIDAKIVGIGKEIIYTASNDAQAEKVKIPKEEVGIIRYANGDLAVYGNNGFRRFPFSLDNHDKLFLASGMILPIQLVGIYPNYIEYISLADSSRELISIPTSEVFAWIPQKKEMSVYLSIANLTQQFSYSRRKPCRYRI